VFSRNPCNPGAFEAGRLIEMKTRGNPSGPEVVKNLNIRPDIWMQLRLLIVVIEEKKLAKKRSPYMGWSIAKTQQIRYTIPFS
jgi:hypothetical protein